MEKERKLIIAGNWKMNKTVAEARDLVLGLKRELAAVKEVDILVAPPFTALAEVSRLILDSNLRLGAQNMSEQKSGAFTGEISADLLKEFSVRYVILGHSERRKDQRETNELVCQKTHAAHAASLKPIVCFGETAEERAAGSTKTVVESQVRGSLAGLSGEQLLETILAYEPVWAIGTGQNATPQQAQEVHSFVRGLIGSIAGEAIARRIRIQYGGSLKPGNARAIMSEPDIDGALVGGASLEVRAFSDIVKNAI